MGGRPKYYEMDGELKSLNAWARQFDKNPSTIWYMMHDMRMTLKEALTTDIVERADSVAKARKVKHERPQPEKPIGICNARCKRCYYGAPGSGIVTCDYILIELKRRPCPAGAACTEFTTRKRRRPNTNGVVGRKRYG